uniref:mediator of RNA polymerase II transcription subunit 19-B-like n=1 Tax=Styela clava TaxID=7725 RepID=UPI00193999DB|nr:mediator of RNA polymerase II transcription subunit 19-B-like [Styela clava]
MNISLQGGDHQIPSSGLGSHPNNDRRNFSHDFFQQPATMETQQMNIEKSEPPVCTSTGIYLLKDQVEPSVVSGSTNLLAHYNLETTYNKFCGGKKVKENLSSFLPDLPGFIDTLAIQDNSSLKALIDRPPVGNKEIQPLSQPLLSSFRLHPGPLPDHYRSLYQSIDSTRRKSKHHKKRRSDPMQNTHINEGEEFEPRKHKKKKHEDGEKKKKKKEKKKKRERDKERT